MGNWEANIRKVVPYVPGEQPKEQDIMKRERAAAQGMRLYLLRSASEPMQPRQEFI